MGILVRRDQLKPMSDAEKAQLTWVWEKMSKSKYNVVTPDEIVERYSADTLRLYELFVAPFDTAIEWKEEGVKGMYRFLGRVWRLMREVRACFVQEWREIPIYIPISTAAAKVQSGFSFIPRTARRRARAPAPLRRQ
ncbi:MAG: hypothetical protein KatS3mg019_0305 [Fimbriimonadales bacterium]|nr:MAG: hypothetical protein KatS3mg019_0305 [Fimbriimonadales bacterium]